MNAIIALTLLVASASAFYHPYAYNAWNARPYAYSAWNARPYAYNAWPYMGGSQYHAQNEFGGYNYGYNDHLSNKYETKDAYGVTHGGYSYVDANGKTQTVRYTSDAVNGFRVEGSNLPVAPEADLQMPVANLEMPSPVRDTPEVAAAKEEFRRQYNEAAAAAAAAPEKREKRDVTAVSHAFPYATAFPYHAFPYHAYPYAAAATLSEAQLKDLKEKVEAKTFTYPYAFPYHAYPYAATLSEADLKELREKVEAKTLGYPYAFPYYHTGYYF